MSIDLIDVGATANDGSGDPIRTAFQTINSNFDYINGGLFAGSEASTISAVSVTGDVIVSNTSVSSNSTTSNSVVVTGAYGGNLFVQSNGAYIVGNVNIVGNLTVIGAQQSTQTSSATAPIILIHANASPYTSDDGRDIGLKWQYYDGTDKYGFLGWQNSTGSLIYQDDITDTANVITAGSFGNVQFGQLLLSNALAATSNTSGALQVKGGISTQGNLYVQENLQATTANISNLAVTGYHVGSLYFTGADTVYINGSPVQTAGLAFNGGTVGLPTLFSDVTPATSAVSGAVEVRGGLGVAGNIWAGNIHANIGGNVRANIQGTIFTSAQPFITSLGTLTGLEIIGQLNVNDVSPNANQTYQLGTSGSDRWLKIWTYDLDASGEITTTSNISVNRSTVAAVQTSTATAEIFNSTATTVRIGSAGVTEFNNNSQAISNSTGAIRLRGGFSIASGNLYIGGSAGNAIVATGAIWTNNILETSSNTQATSTTTGALHVQGGASITQGNLYIGGSGGNSIIVTGSIVPSSNLASTNNIGSPTLWWNTFYGISTQAQYADLAEKYIADSNYQTGTVVVFGGTKEITTTNEFADCRVAGVISENPAYLMNANSEGQSVALRGRVPVRIIGPVSKGDLLVTSTTPGYARSVGRDNSYGSAVFAKSITQDSRNGTKIIEAVII